MPGGEQCASCFGACCGDQLPPHRVGRRGVAHIGCGQALARRLTVGFAFSGQSVSSCLTEPSRPAYSGFLLGETPRRITPQSRPAEPHSATKGEPAPGRLRTEGVGQQESPATTAAAASAAAASRCATPDAVASPAKRDVLCRLVPSDALRRPSALLSEPVCLAPAAVGALLSSVACR